MATHAKQKKLFYHDARDKITFFEKVCQRFVRLAYSLVDAGEIPVPKTSFVTLLNETGPKPSGPVFVFHFLHSPLAFGRGKMYTI